MADAPIYLIEIIDEQQARIEQLEKQVRLLLSRLG